jgi:hypothetical protein
MSDGSPTRPVAHEGYHGLSWVSYSELEWLIERLPRDGLFIEVGTASGVTAALCARARPRLSVLCVDTFVDQHQPWVIGGEPCRIDNWRCNRQPNMTLFVGTLGQFATLQPLARARAILIDGDHEGPAVLDDLLSAQGLLLEGGMIFVHDYGEPSLPDVKSAVDGFMMSTRFRPVDDHWTMLAIQERESPFL